MKHIQILLLTLTGMFLSSCTVGYNGIRRGPCGGPMGPGFGGQFGSVGNPWARNYIPGNVIRDGRYYDARRRANEVHFDFNQFDDRFGSPYQGGYAVGFQPSGYGGGSGQRFTPSGRAVACPGCKAQIRNAPNGRFPCQKCGATVSN